MRAFFVLTLVMTGTVLSGCATQDKDARATTGAKSTKLAHAAAMKTVKAKPAKSSADPVRTASLSASPRAAGAEAELAGKTLIYRYGGARGTILYRADGTLTYDEPGIRSGTGKWQVLDGKLCQSFSGISEPCQTLRKSGQTYYAGPMTLVMAKP
ncbi:MAG: hypothetical protein ACREDW_03580 [Aestuariivirgaceae bacterium]